MKNALKIFGLFAALFVIFAFGKEDNKEAESLILANSVPQVFGLDTITNTGTETKSISATFASAYQYVAQIQTTRISGTPSIKFYLEQTAATGSTRWAKVDSVSVVSHTGTMNWTMAKPYIYGNKLRITAVGSGTQSVSFRIDFLAKPTR